MENFSDLSKPTVFNQFVVSKPAISNNNSQTNTASKTPEAKDEFVKKNKKIIIAASAAGIIAALGGFYALAKSGKLGDKLQEFASNLFKSSSKTQIQPPSKTENINAPEANKITMFTNKEGEAIEGVTVEKGFAKLEDGSGFTGIMDTTSKNGHDVTIRFENGYINESAVDDVVCKKFENIPEELSPTGQTLSRKEGQIVKNSSGEIVSIQYFDENGKSKRNIDKIQIKDGNNFCYLENRNGQEIGYNNNGILEYAYLDDKKIILKDENLLKYEITEYKDSGYVTKTVSAEIPQNDPNYFLKTPVEDIKFKDIEALQPQPKADIVEQAAKIDNSAQKAKEVASCSDNISDAVHIKVPDKIEFFDGNLHIYHDVIVEDGIAKHKDGKMYTGYMTVDKTNQDGTITGIEYIFNNGKQTKLSITERKSFEKEKQIAEIRFYNNGNDVTIFEKDRNRLSFNTNSDEYEVITNNGSGRTIVEGIKILSSIEDIVDNQKAEFSRNPSTIKLYSRHDNGFSYNYEPDQQLYIFPNKFQTSKHQGSCVGIHKDKGLFICGQLKEKAPATIIYESQKDMAAKMSPEEKAEFDKMKENLLAGILEAKKYSDESFLDTALEFIKSFEL